MTTDHNILDPSPGHEATPCRACGSQPCRCEARKIVARAGEWVSAPSDVGWCSGRVIVPERPASREGG